MGSGDGDYSQAILHPSAPFNSRQDTSANGILNGSNYTRIYGGKFFNVVNEGKHSYIPL